MLIEESGTVVEVRGPTALVRLERSPACAGCASAGRCRAGHDGSGKLLEALNDAGAAAGDAVRVAVPAGERLETSARTYLLPVAGSLLGAAAADVLAGALHPALAGGNAAGLGGIAGALLGLYFGRRPRRRAAAGASPPPRITRILAAVDSPANRD